MNSGPARHHRRSIRLTGYDYTRAGAYFVTICTYKRQCLFGHIGGGRAILSESGRLVERCWRTIPRHFPGVALDAFVVMPNHIHGIIVITDVTDAGGHGDETHSPKRALVSGTHRGRRGEAFAHPQQSALFSKGQMLRPYTVDHDVDHNTTHNPGDNPGHPRGHNPNHNHDYPLSSPSEPLPHGTHSGSLGAIIQNFKSVLTRKIHRMDGTTTIPLWQRNYHEHIIRNEIALITIRRYIQANPRLWPYDRHYQP